MVTQCGLAELHRLVERLGGEYKGALQIARDFYLIKCGHAENSRNGKPLPAGQCVCELLKRCPADCDTSSLKICNVADSTYVAARNFRHWLVGTQDETVKQEMRKIPGTPIFSLHGQVLRLETMSKATLGGLGGGEGGVKNTKNRGGGGAVSGVPKSLGGGAVSSAADAIPKWEQDKLPVLKREEELKAQLLAERKTRKKKKGRSGPNPLSCKKKKVKKPAEMEKAGGVDATTAAVEVGPKKKKTRSRRNRAAGGDSNVEASGGRED